MYQPVIRTQIIKSSVTLIRPFSVRSRHLADFNNTTKSSNPVHEAAESAGQKKDTSPSNPSVVSSEGAIGKQFNPEGNVGQVGEKVGGPFSKDGVIGSQFDASKGGIAGTVERAVDGPRNPAKKS